MEKIQRRAHRVALLIRAGRVSFGDGLAAVRRIADAKFELACGICGTDGQIETWTILQEELRLL